MRMDGSIKIKDNSTFTLSEDETTRKGKIDHRFLFLKKFFDAEFLLVYLSMGREKI